jgi:hypothetical protein
MADHHIRRFIIEREKPSGLASWIGYARTMREARTIAYAQPVIDGKPIRIVHGRGKRHGEVIERI